MQLRSADTVHDIRSDWPCGAMMSGPGFMDVRFASGFGRAYPCPTQPEQTSMNKVDCSLDRSLELHEREGCQSVDGNKSQDGWSTVDAILSFYTFNVTLRHRA